MSDRVLDLHGEVIRIMLAAYLDHLATVWRSSDDSVTAVASVLAGSCRSFAPEHRQLVRSLLADLSVCDDGPLALARDRLQLAPGEELLVATGWWSEVDPQLGSVFGVLHDDGGRRHPSSGLVHLVAAAFGVDVPVHPRRLIASGVIESTGPTERLALTPTMREVLAGRIDAGDQRETAGSVHGAGPDPALVDALVALLESGDGAVAVRGGHGRRSVVSAAAERMERVVLEADRPTAELRLVVRLGLAIAVLDGDAAADVTAGWEAGDGPLVVMADGECAVAAAHVLEVPGPGQAARQSAWADALGGVTVADGLVGQLADRFDFSPADIAATVRRAGVMAAVQGRDPTDRDVWTAAQQRPDGRLGHIATRIDPAFSLDDLVLPPRTASRLRELTDQVAFRTTVLDDWGFRRRLARGSGVAALFAGPPGTGKTTAAEAIAHELGTMLFRVDLSRVVSKYIGETEKNLALAFREAECSGAMLLFDEADALFGKRTEVRDAHDRYANLEVSYLLQRVETFTGLVVLSTNRLGNVDDAFLRRLRFVIRFEQPTRDERAELWRRSFPDLAAVGDLDWDQLATHDLSGGHIQSAALAAAFLAVGNGRVIERSHVDRAVAHEYEKLDRAAPGGGS